MKVYLAARYARHPEMRLRRADLEDFFGYEVTAQWINGEHEKLDGEYVDNEEAVRQSKDGNYIPGSVMFAKHDIRDIEAADAFILFTDGADWSGPKAARGGRHWETGYAYALGKKIILIGPKENVFHYLPEIEHYEDWYAFIDAEARRLGPESRVVCVSRDAPDGGVVIKYRPMPYSEYSAFVDQRDSRGA